MRPTLLLLSIAAVASAAPVPTPDAAEVATDTEATNKVWCTWEGCGRRSVDADVEEREVEKRDIERADPPRMLLGHLLHHFQ